jgi:hypothetical protein
MPVLSTTRNAFAALLSAACAAGCAQSANNPGSDFGSGNQGDDSGAVPEAAANTAASGQDAGAGAQMMGAASSSGGGSSSSGGTASSSGSSGSSGSGSSSSGGSSMSTPDAGSVMPMTFGDGGPCTPNLSCMLNPPPSTGDIRVDCVNRINQFRTTCACLKPLARWTDGEACADMDAMYDGMKMVGHAGAMANICPWGQAQDECPGYPSNQSVIGTCLQQMWSEGPPPAGTTIAQCESAQMYQTCYEMHGHFINMSNPMVTKVACGFATASGGAIWAAQNFSY